ncbi:hypothetical protein F4818DRAFT_430945 [Hypoxylon cercidicola]|nr:hypothetical protein F4818DRAFT_430945 [Hypoxylon cercidicola]
MSLPHNELLPRQAIVRVGLARPFPVGSETSFAQMARVSGLREANIRQILRLATLQHIFSEPRPSVITHTSVSRLLAEDRAPSDWVGASVDDLWQAASQTCDAMVKYPG